MATAETKAITGGRLIDGSGKAPVDNATVVVEGSKIKVAGQNVEIPGGATVIEAGGKTVMPGMIDAHIHFKGVLPSDTDMDNISRPQEVKLIKAVFDARDCLARGFTTVRECGGMNGIYLRRAASEGTVSGIPRIISAGYTLKNTRSIPAVKYMSPEYLDARTSRIAGKAGREDLICDGVDECIKATRYALAQGADFIKVQPTGGSYFDLEELKAIARTAEYHHKFITSHCDDARQIKETIIAGAKTVDHAVGIDDEGVELGNKNGIVFVSTLVVMQAIIDYATGEKREMHGKEWAKGMLEKMSTGYKKIRQAGGIMAIGTDLGGEPLLENVGTSAVEIELLMNYCDFTPMEAIVAATKHGAMACCLGDKTGTIEAGKSADIIIVDGDPLADIKVLQDKDKIKMVMLEGRNEKSGS